MYFAEVMSFGHFPWHNCESEENNFPSVLLANAMSDSESLDRNDSPSFTWVYA